MGGLTEGHDGGELGVDVEVGRRAVDLGLEDHLGGEVGGWVGGWGEEEEKKEEKKEKPTLGVVRVREGLKVASSPPCLLYTSTMKETSKRGGGSSPSSSSESSSSFLPRVGGWVGG